MFWKILPSIHYRAGQVISFSCNCASVKIIWPRIARALPKRDWGFFSKIRVFQWLEVNKSVEYNFSRVRGGRVKKTKKTKQKHHLVIKYSPLHTMLRERVWLFSPFPERWVLFQFLNPNIFIFWHMPKLSFKVESSNRIERVIWGGLAEYGMILSQYFSAHHWV